MAQRGLRLRDVMSTEIVSVAPETTLRDVAAAFAGELISGAPVVTDGRVLGVVSVTDLVERLAAARRAGREPPTSRGRSARSEVPGPWPGRREPPAEFFTRYWADRGVDVRERVAEAAGGDVELLDDLTAADVMSGALHSLPPDTALAAAADYMLEREIHRVLVMEDGRLVGVVTTTDMVRAMSGGVPAGRS